MPAPTSGARNWDVQFREDGTAWIIGRLVSPDGSGDATGKPGEGYWCEQADVSSITYRVTDEEDDSETGTGTLVIADTILDTPRTPTGTGDNNSDALWGLDPYGYNLIATIPASCFPTGGQTYRVELKFTFQGGAIGWAVIRGEAIAIATS